LGGIRIGADLSGTERGLPNWLELVAPEEIRLTPSGCARPVRETPATIADVHDRCKSASRRQNQIRVPQKNPRRSASRSRRSVPIRVPFKADPRLLERAVRMAYAPPGVMGMMNLQRTVLRAAAAWAVLGVAVLAQGQGQAEQTGMPAGDASRGKALVESNNCFDCHRIDDRGSRLGPNLSDIGSRRTPQRLQQAMIAPDEEVLTENRFVRFVTKDGATVTGKLLNQDAMSVQLLTPKEELKTYMRINLREYTVLDKGLMPSVQGKLSEQQVADIVSYLGSLKGSNP
jgi:putative heme-binding domain-containing protein